MAKLILSLDGVVIRDIKIDQDRISIGRKPHNEVVIDNLAVSGEHSLVTRVGQEIFVEDLGSTNGTLVNGEPIKKHELQDNDMIEIGKYKLKFVAEKLQRPAADDFEKTMVIRSPLSGGQMPPPVAPRPAPAPVAAAAPAVRMGALQILTGSHAGKELELTKNLTTIGKTGEQVAVVTRRPTGYFITHVDGPRHPMVNGVELDAQAHALSEHDIIELAGIKMEFFFKT